MNMSVQSAVGEFLVGVTGEVSESTQEWYARCLSSFVEFVGDGCLNEVTAATLRAYRADLLGREMSPYSVHGRQRAVRRLFSWLLKEGVITHNVALDVPFVRLPNEPPKALADEDMMRLLEQLPAESVRDRAIILFLIDTGCRRGGLCSLTLDSVDLPNRCATVVEKGKKGRRVYFTEMTAETLALYLSVRPAVVCDALFVSVNGTALTEDGIRMLLARVGKRAGVKGRINAHSFRHAFARNFLRNGGNLAALGRLLGHAPGSPVTAKYYGVWDDRDLQEFHGRFSPLSGMRAGDKQSGA